MYAKGHQQGSVASHEEELLHVIYVPTDEPQVDNYVQGWKAYFANKVYAVVDKVFNQGGQHQLTIHEMPSRCDVTETEIEESP